jgi:signal transduction histidine kinase
MYGLVARPYHEFIWACNNRVIESIFHCGESLLLHVSSASFASEQSTTELACFSTMLRGRSVDWSQKARAIRYELEYKPVEQERRRIASELHDEVLPLLSRLSRSVQRHDRSAKIIGPKINEAIDTIRDLLGELHPVDLEELGLGAAIANLCSRYTKQYGNRIIYRESGDEWAFSDLRQVAVYRALQLVLRMFAQKGSGQLVIAREASGGQYKIALWLRNSNHSAVRSLINEMTEQDLDAFSGWSSIAQMQVHLLAGPAPDRVIFSITDQETSIPQPVVGSKVHVDEQSQARLVELEHVVTAAQEEWVEIIKGDAKITGNMAVAIERQRLCRVVEDLVYPGLEEISRLALQAKANDRSRTRALGPADDLVRRMIDIKAALDNVISATYPEELVSLNLVELVRLSVERFRRATMINARIVAGKVEQVQTLTLEKKIAAFRIIHEALHNVEKHAQATTVLVLVEPAREHVVVCVEDNGLGIGENNSIDSRGIRGVKERAQEIGASVSWQKSISYETGTLVTIKLPIC